MDDNIIEHYTNQSAFLIEMSEVSGGQFQITLIEVWKPVSKPAPLKDVTNHSCQFKTSLRALPSQRQCKLWTTKTSKENRIEETPPDFPTSVDFCKYHLAGFLWFCWTL